MFESLFSGLSFQCERFQFVALPVSDKNFIATIAVDIADINAYKVIEALFGFHLSDFF